MNVNELVFDSVRSVTANDDDGSLLFRLTSIEDGTLSTTTESEEVVDAKGQTITKLYKAKKATFAASNSLISTDLLAAQYGTEKSIASNSKKIITPTFEILTPAAGVITLSKKPVGQIKYIYALKGKDPVKKYEASGTGAATETAFKLDTSSNKITVPTSDQTSKYYVEYNYEAENAVGISNKANGIPKSCALRIYCYYRDVCNDNIKYSGVIVADKAKLNPEQIEMALNSTGKHPFTFDMIKDYCGEEDAELFRIIVAE